MKIILIGFATSYKSSVATVLGKKLNLSVVDTDSVIEQQQGQSVWQIFEDKGEEYFRAQEQLLVDELSNTDNVVISCGGGTVLAPNFGNLASSATVVWLTVGANSVKYRLTKGTRPLFDNLSVEQLQQKILSRAPLYQQYAQQVVCTDHRTSNQVARQILGLLNNPQ